ncbi:ABC transporter permease [Azovibrio restrictus]|uniref:ABC transporter permease n=1 Tax=Azovibrio restrictus TaxID=146938 RepID=UPI0026F0320C|nr:ABC transporter permease [Azovibrio restrictus]
MDDLAISTPPISASSTGNSRSRIVIRPRSDTTLFDSVRDLWSNRDIAWTLALREIQIRYKQTLVGVAWAVMQPLVTTVIFTLVFGVLAKIPTDGAPYPVFVLMGLLFWQYFSKVVVESSGSLVKNEGIITKVFFPRLILPLVPALSAAVDLGVSLVILLVLMLIYGIVPTPYVFLLPLLMAFAGLLGYGIGLLLSPVNAIYRDVGIALPFFVQIGMYVTPVIYPVSFVPQHWQWVFLLNPVATLLDTARAALLGTPFPSLAAFGTLIAWIALIFAFGLRTFRKLEPTIVDRI